MAAETSMSFQSPPKNTAKEPDTSAYTSSCCEKL